jgi:hypothetical protein
LTQARRRSKLGRCSGAGSADADARGATLPIDAEAALGVSRKLAASRTLLRSTPPRLHLLLSLLEPSSRKGGKARGGAGRGGDDGGDGGEKGAGGFNARLRQGVLRVLGDAFRADPQLLENSFVLQVVRQRYVGDASALVRAAAVDILAAYGAHSRRVDPPDLGAFCTRALDVSAMVRLSASNALAAVVTLGRQYHAKEKAGASVGVWQAQKEEALLRLCRLAVDQEATVRKRALRQVVELWFLAEPRAASSHPPLHADAAAVSGPDGESSAMGAGSGSSSSAGGDGARAMKGVVDEMVAVAMFTITEHARKGLSGTSAGDMCLLRRVLIRALDAGEGSAGSGGAGAGGMRADDAATPSKGKSSKRGAKEGAAGGVADAAAAPAAAAAAAAAIGAEDETMDAGGAAHVVVVSESERIVVEQQCRAACALLAVRIVQLRPKRASTDSDEAGDRPSDASVISGRLERLLGATAALLSFVQTLPHLVWSIPNVIALIETEAVDVQALEELVGDGSRFYGLRMRVVAQAALLAEAVIAAAPPSQLKKAILPLRSALERHLAATANRVRHHGALNAVIKCLCTLSTTVLPHVGLPEVALLSLSKYVDFLAKFAKQRSQRLLPFVSSALLGAGAYCRFLDWKSLLTGLKDGKHGGGARAGKENSDGQASPAAALARFERHHARTVQMCVGVLADDPDERVRRCAMQCLGGMLVHSPTLLLQEQTSRLVKRALRGEIDAASQHAVLEAFRVFLEEEDKQMMQQLRAGRGAAAAGEEPGKSQRVSDMSTSLANDYLPLILDATFPRRGASDPAAASATASAAAAEVMMDASHAAAGSASQRVRLEAMALLKVIMRRGLTAPSRVAASLIALSAWDDHAAQAAADIFGALHRKNAELSQPSMIIAGVNAFISRVVGAGPGTGSAGGGGQEEEGETRCQPLYDKAFASAFALCAGACSWPATVAMIVTLAAPCSPPPAFLFAFPPLREIARVSFRVFSHISNRWIPILKLEPEPGTLNPNLHSVASNRRVIRADACPAT